MEFRVIYSRGIEGPQSVWLLRGWLSTISWMWVEHIYSTLCLGCTRLRYTMNCAMVLLYYGYTTMQQNDKLALPCLFISRPVGPLNVRAIYQKSPYFHSHTPTTHPTSSPSAHTYSPYSSGSRAASMRQSQYVSPPQAHVSGLPILTPSAPCTHHQSSVYRSCPSCCLFHRPLFCHARRTQWAVLA
jgi:hypothetical protein